MQQSKHQCFVQDLQVHVQMLLARPGYHGCGHERWVKNLLEHYENASANEDGLPDLTGNPFCKQEKNIKAIEQKSI